MLGILIIKFLIILKLIGPFLCHNPTRGLMYMGWGWCIREKCSNSSPVRYIHLIENNFVKVMNLSLIPPAMDKKEDSIVLIDLYGNRSRRWTIQNFQL